MGSTNQKPILIVGSGISGLLLAQHLRKSSIPFRLYERDSDLDTRGLGWGLTLHWSLPAVRSLLPDDLVSRLPEAYVDRSAVEEGRPSTFPFYDLSTGELKASTPNADESQRIRVSRDKFRRLLATGLDIQFGKGATGKFETDEQDGSVRVHFEDGTVSEEGSLVVACDGGSSRLRQVLFPDSEKFKIPVRLMGVKVECTPEEIEPLRKLDPYFLQGAASENDTFVYFSSECPLFFLTLRVVSHKANIGYQSTRCPWKRHRQGHLHLPDCRLMACSGQFLQLCRPDHISRDES